MFYIKVIFFNLQKVRETVNVDPSLVHVVLLDDITHSLLMGDNSKHKSYITKINRIFLVSKDDLFFFFYIVLGQNCPLKYGKFENFSLGHIRICSL